MAIKVPSSGFFPSNETILGGERHYQQQQQQQHLTEARHFLKCMQALSRIQHREIQQAIASAVVTLGEAATMCGIGARELWSQYVILGILRMYNSDVPATDFIRVTHLLQDVVVFFCEQERIRRYHSQSYQEIIKNMLIAYAKKDYKSEQVLHALSFYFNMSCSEAIFFESKTIILSRYFESYSPSGASSLQVNINNTNSVNNEINIDLNGLAQDMKDLAGTMSHTQPTSGATPPPAQTAPTAPVNESVSATSYESPTHEACLLVIAAIKQGNYLDEHGEIGPKEFLAKVKVTMQAHGKIKGYRVAEARTIYAKSSELKPFKRKPGFKKVR